MISIITINYKSPEETSALINSLLKNNFQNWELIVVNNSPEQDFPFDCQDARIQIVAPEYNLGFAGGNNFGARYAKGDYLFFLNNDMTLSPQFLSEMNALLAANPQVEVLSPNIAYAANEHEGKLQYAGYGNLNRYLVQAKAITTQAVLGQLQNTPFIHGGAVVVSRSAINATQGMPEQYFLYYEELAWSELLKQAGYKLFHYSGLTARHKASASVGQNSPLKAYYLNRNRLLFAINHIKGVAGILAVFYLLTIALPAKILLNIFKRAHFAAMFKAWKHAIFITLQIIIYGNHQHYRYSA